MIFKLNYCLKRRLILNVQSLRLISTNEIATVLRPFYFVVHPDLFGRYPEQRAVNENSIKQLGVYLEALQNRKLNTQFPSQLPFYVRNADTEVKGDFKLVNIPLEKCNDTKIALKKILKACSLPTDNLKKLKNDNPVNNHEDFTETYQQRSNRYEYMDESIIFEKVNDARQEQTLNSWFLLNKKVALTRSESLKEMKDEILRLEENIKSRLKLKDVRYECGWNVEHYRGCLKSLENLANLHENDVQSLKGRVVVFGPFTGVSLDGHIMLFTGDVHRSWLDLLRNISKHDSHLKKIPAYEYALSQILRNIRIKRRKFMPKTHASEYTGHLRQVMTTLLDFLSKTPYPKSWPDTLENFEIVIESESGPLMVSPTGQIIAPSTCPGFLLVDFISNHLKEAEENATQYKKNKYVEKSLHDQAVINLKLSSLQKDDSVTPERMIQCLERLISSNLLFKDIDLHITHYYSVLADGTVCIPWDWKI